MQKITVKDANHYQLDDQGNQRNVSTQRVETTGNLLDSDSEGEDQDEEEKGGMLDMISRTESVSTVRTTLTRVMRSLNFERESAQLELGGTLRRSRNKDGSTSFTLPGAKITAFSTSIFQRMRAMDEIYFEQISRSLNPRKNRDQIFKTGTAAGASGSFFFFSHDRRFIVKTMS